VKRTVPILFVWFMIIAPVTTLVVGWGYASVRENRLKERVVEQMEAAHDPLAAHERSYMVWHRRVEIAGLAALALLLAFSATVTCIAVKRQRELSDKKTAFIAAVTHELRTPLTTLRMHAEMLDQDLVPDDRKKRVYEELARETERLSRLVENVLAMSKLEEGRWVIEKKRGDLAHAVESVVDSLEPRAKELGFALSFHAEPECRTIEFDPRAVELAVQNLVDNALKYAAESEPHQVEIAVEPNDAGVRLVVKDHGPGIAVAMRERVFDRFDRAGASEKKPGTGLGLALVRELARAHGGDARILEVTRGLAVAVDFPA
jgi:signal transduction histidine kinase